MKKQIIAMLDYTLWNILMLTEILGVTEMQQIKWVLWIKKYNPPQYRVFQKNRLQSCRPKYSSVMLLKIYFTCFVGTEISF